MIPARGNSDNGGYINMQHSHTIIDKDNHFIINPVTRKIQPETHEKNKLVEGDHNSEKYTFEIPKTIEGHDMSQCNIVRINYLNISSDKSKKVEDVYEVDDLGILEDKPDTLAFTWTIKETATRYSGLLSFAITFKCTTDNLVDYAWHTEIYSAISIGIGMDNSEIIVTEYSDILDKWKKELFAIDGTIQTTARKSLEEIEKAKNNSLESIAQHGTVQVSNEEPTDPNVDLFINPDETVSVSIPEINDSGISTEDTWSSEKIDSELKVIDNKILEVKEETAQLKEDIANIYGWKEITPIEVVEGKLIQLDTKDEYESSISCYAKTEISNGVKKIKVSGRSASAQYGYGLAAFYDLNLQYISSIASEDSTEYVDKEVTVPNSAKYIIVNFNGMKGKVKNVSAFMAMPVADEIKK